MPEGTGTPEAERRLGEGHQEEGGLAEGARLLDVRGLACPLPILRTRRLLDAMAAGEEVTVLTTDPASEIDFRHFCNTTENALVAFARGEAHFTFRIRRG
jgi:tRNA 2-thiouridine synthesizing protein A